MMFYRYAESKEIRKQTYKKIVFKIIVDRIGIEGH